MAIQVAIEGYDSLEQIGLGGMAAVYRARKVSIDKTVAIKILFPYLATDNSFIERFQREAKAAASIQHENIVNVIDFGESEGSFYIVMEYYDGRTLESLMKERPGLPPEIAIHILLEVAYGLEAAHALDIVHRDIKPANIIFTNQGGVKIADFGLARKSDSLSMITQHGKVMGTPAYMSPEQAAGRPVGPASDIFSFGVVAYELLGRRKPFDGRTYSDVLDKIQTSDPAPVTMANPLVAPEFERIVQRALAKNEKERHASATALIADIEAAMDANQIARDRRRLASYAREPEPYDAAFAESTIAQCMSRGAYFTQKGSSHLKEAMLEYRRVLFIDPEHSRARASLAKLGDDPGTIKRTAASADAEATRVMPATGVRPARVTRKRPRWVAPAASALVLGGLALAWWLMSSPGIPDSETSGEGAALSRDVEMAGPNQPMASSTADAPLVPVPVAADTTQTTLKKPALKPADNAAKKTSASKKPSTATTPVVSVARDSSRKEAVAPPTLEPGFLSVYFLGGVGEIWIDGDKFAYQPPFDRASIAAGTHTVSCRMTGDETARELSITIRPGRETVIEYEIGGVPAVSEE